MGILRTWHCQNRRCSKQFDAWTANPECPACGCVRVAWVPGGGAGNKAAATQQVKAVIPALLMASMAFESGSKEQQSLLRAIQSLNPIFGKAEGSNMVPAALATMAQASKQGPLSAAPPPGLVSNNTPPPSFAGGAEPPGAAA